MKYILVGLHCSGKQETINILESWGVQCGKHFSNLEKPSRSIYNSYNYELCDTIDINEIFENKSYVYINELQSPSHSEAYKTYEGLAKYTFENNDVFVLSPDQLLCVPNNVFDDDVCFVWLDNPKYIRLCKYHNDGREYGFKEREDIEYKDTDAFVKRIYGNKNILYFTNEDPARIATIIYTLIKYPDLLDMYIKQFS